MNKKYISKITSGVLLCTMVAYTTPVLAITKDETVYSKLDSNGAEYSTIVSSHLINSEGLSTIDDFSDLSGIKNVNGDEEFSQSGSELVWNAGESDIYYQGESDKELPIECSVKYELDGEKLSAEEIAGKSGNVKVTLEYTNKDEHTASINGKNVKMYTPFVVVAGTIIDNDNAKNIKVSSGKTIDNGSKTIIAGICFPGLQESLNISKEEMEIPSKIEITMEATKFELSNVITYVTPKVIEEDDLSIFDEMDEIYSRVNTLQKSSKALVEGANELKEGANTYSEKSQEFNSAMKQVSDGMSSANSSYEQIDTAIDTLNQNTGTLTSGAKSVSEGTEAVSQSLGTISEKLDEIKTGTQTLQAGEEQLNDGLNQIIQSVNQISTTDNSSKIAQLEELNKANESTLSSLKSTVESLNTSLESETDEQTKQTITSQINSNTALIALIESNISATQSTIETLKNTDSSQISQLQEGLNSLSQGISQLQAGTETLYEGETALKAGTDTLASKTQELAQGSETLYQGTVSISNGVKTLNAGSDKMKDGLNTLDDSSQKLLDANNSLVEGAKTISDGATTISDGITQFDNEAIEPICDLINSDVKDIQARVEKLQELSEQYNNFTMINGEHEGSVRFIMVMDSVKYDESTKQDMIVEEKNKDENEN